MRFISTVVHCIVAALLFPVVAASSCKGRTTSPVAEEAVGVGRGPRDPEASLSTPIRSGDGEQQAKEATTKGEATMEEKYEFTLEEKRWLMKLAKDAVKAAVEGRKFDPPVPESAILREKGAAFVTLKKGGKLRGCIGHTVAREPLFKCVASVARSAAIEDPRFEPVKPSEYESLHFEISVLTPLQEVKKPEEIVVGKDGVVLSYEGGSYQGVFLPHVPVEQGWDLTEYLDNLCYKAGVRKKGCWKDPQAVLRKFQAIVWGEEDL